MSSSGYSVMYRYMSLREIKRLEPEMKRLSVSRVARSRSGFLPQFKRANGDPNRLSEHWRIKREGFVARHLAQQKKHKTYRRSLALAAWAYRG